MSYSNAIGVKECGLAIDKVIPAVDALKAALNQLSLIGVN
jgi:hypothetical protein